MKSNKNFFIVLIFTIYANCDVMQDTIRHCEIINSQKKCTKCLNGFVLDINSLCVDISNVETKQNNIINTSNNPTTSSGLPLVLPTKLPIQQSMIESNKENKGGNSIENSFASGVSVQSVQDLNCKTKENNGYCSECFQAYYFNVVYKLCVPVSPLCKTWNNQGECLSCFDGYGLINGMCFIPTVIDNKDPNCFIYVNGVCQNCSYRFYFNSDRVCTIVHPDCKTWNSQNGACSSCYDGYLLDKTQCIFQKKLSDLSSTNNQVTTNNKQIQNCASYNSKFQCAKCSYRYYYANKVCNPVSNLCKEWNLQDGQCTSCYGGYELLLGKCTLEDPFCTIKSNQGCLQCANRYFLNINSICEQVSSLCKSYDPLYGACTECFNGFKLNEGSCVF